MRTEFLAGLRAILADDQAALWPEFERLLRREKTLGRGQLSGESVNLFILLRELGLGNDELDQLTETLDGYSVDLDRVLVARNTFLDESSPRIFEAMREGDMDTAMLLTADEARLRIGVRSVNEQYLEALAAELEELFGPEHAEALRIAFRDEAFERIFRPTVMERSFEVARGFEDVDEEVRAAIESLMTAYEAELDVQNELLVQASREEEPLRNKRRLEQRLARMNDMQPPDEQDLVREGFRTRDELDRRYRPQLESMLTAEQIAQLPEMPPLREDRAQGRGRGPGNRGQDPAADQAARDARRAEIIKQFDADGDGDLNDEERQAAREYFRQQREASGDGGGPGRGGPGRGGRGGPGGGRPGGGGGGA